MDLKVYYRKMREIEAGLPEGDVVVASLETPDGGREGVFNEVSRSLAAKLLVEAKARLASDDEAAAFKKSVRERSLKAKEETVTNKLQVEIVGERRTRSRKSDRPTD